MPTRHPLLDACHEIQSGSPNDLVVWASPIGQMAILSWPLKEQGIAIKAGSYRQYLRTRGVHLDCFCVLLMPPGSSASCRIVATKRGPIVAYCHHYPNRCDFFLNLTVIAKRTSYVATFGHFPTLASPNVPDIDVLVTMFNAQQGRYIEGALSIFEGYLGEYNPDVEQMAGDPEAVYRGFDEGVERGAAYLKHVLPGLAATAVASALANLPATIQSAPPRLQAPRPSIPRKGTKPGLILSQFQGNRRISNGGINKKKATKDTNPTLIMKIVDDDADRSASCRSKGKARAPATPSISDDIIIISDSDDEALLGPPSLSSYPSSSTLSTASTLTTPPSSQVAEAGPSSGITGAELHLLNRLLAGDGIPPDQAEGLVEQCPYCYHLFAGAFFRKHLPGCASAHSD